MSRRLDLLHSLDVAQRWKDRPVGEADFVVLVPGAGILCIEAKSYVYRDAQREMLTTPPTPLSREDAASVVRMLRAEVECYESPRARIDRAAGETKRYTDEQFRVLDLFGGNARFLVDGLAGTGKTLLAIEIVRRAVLSGQRVLLACYNTMLGEWLASETEPLGDACIARTFHEYMRDVVGDTAAHSDEDSVYWQESLPSSALDMCVFRCKPNTRYARSRTVIPLQAEHLLRRKPNTCYAASRTPIPPEAEHFRPSWRNRRRART